MIVPYQPMSKDELVALEARYGRELSEREALYLLRQERENRMRENQFYGSTPVEREPRITAHDIVVVKPSSRWWVLPAFILLALIVGEVWLAAHYMSVIKGWFR